MNKVGKKYGDKVGKNHGDKVAKKHGDKVGKKHGDKIGNKEDIITKHGYSGIIQNYGNPFSPKIWDRSSRTRINRNTGSQI